MSKVKLCDSCEYINNCSYKNIKPKSNDLTKECSYYSKDENLTPADSEKLKIDLFEKFNQKLIDMSDAEQKYLSDKNNSEYASKYAIVSKEYYDLVVVLRDLERWDAALKYCVDRGTLDSDILKTDEEKEIEELTKIIENTFSYAKKYYPDKYEPFELNVYPDEIARVIIENGYRKVK